jgi:hypothetical protein
MSTTETHFDLEVRYDFEADPGVLSLKVPLGTLQKLMADPTDGIVIHHAEVAETLRALVDDSKAPLQDRSVAIELLKLKGIS